jgi:hypothetical protein
MPPQVNATLTAVHGADAETGGRDDWDAPAVQDGTPDGPSKWTGTADAYYREDVTRVGPDVVEVRALYVDSAVAREAGIDTDDVLSFTDPAGNPRTARASVVAIRELDGIPADLQTARLELEPR